MLFSKTIIKCLYFLLLERLQREWELQVQNLHDFWNAVGDMIDRAELWLSFTSECFELELSFEDYAIEEAFEKAKKEWSEELMILVADMILKWYDDDIPTTAKIVTMEDGRIQVDIAICQLYASRDHLNALQIGSRDHGV